MTNEQMTLSIAEMDSADHEPNAFSLELLRRRYPELDFLFNEVTQLRDEREDLPSPERFEELEDDLRQWQQDFYATDDCLTQVAMLVDEAGSPMLHEAVQSKLDELGKGMGR